MTKDEIKNIITKPIRDVLFAHLSNPMAEREAQRLISSLADTLFDPVNTRIQKAREQHPDMIIHDSEGRHLGPRRV